MEWGEAIAFAYWRAQPFLCFPLINFLLTTSALFLIPPLPFLAASGPLIPSSLCHSLPTQPFLSCILKPFSLCHLSIHLSCQLGPFFLLVAAPARLVANSARDREETISFEIAWSYLSCNDTCRHLNEKTNNLYRISSRINCT